MGTAGTLIDALARLLLTRAVHNRLMCRRTFDGHPAACYRGIAFLHLSSFETATASPLGEDVLAGI